MSNSYDLNKDYYSLLGHDSNATIEELKSSHIKLALKFHPDASVSSDQETKQLNEIKFREISEAWSVLSKPDLKLQYDRDRANKLNIKLPTGTEYHYSNDNIGEVTRMYGVDVSRSRFQSAQKYSPQDWKSNLSKYRSDKWQKLPLKDKKASRVKTIPNLSLTAFQLLFPVAAAVVIYYQFK